jgi:hypothetical protein
MWGARGVPGNTFPIFLYATVQEHQPGVEPRMSGFAIRCLTVWLLMRGDTANQAESDEGSHIGKLFD